MNEIEDKRTDFSHAVLRYTTACRLRRLEPAKNLSAIVLIFIGGLLEGDLIVRAQMWCNGKTPFTGGGLIADVPASREARGDSPETFWLVRLFYRSILSRGRLEPPPPDTGSGRAAGDGRGGHGWHHCARGH